MKHDPYFRIPISKEDALRTINAFALDIMSITNEADLFWHLVKNVVGQLNFADCIAYQANKEQTHLTQVAALGPKNPTERTIKNPLVIPFGQGITGSVAVHQHHTVVDDLSLDPRYIADSEPALSEICVPLIFQGRVAGVIDCEDKNKNAFSAQDIEILVTIAAITSAKLELLHEAEQLELRLKQLNQAHHKLQEEMKMRKELEDKLLQRRKMEAIGKISGGVAHDFNNLLSVILGNMELLEGTVELDEENAKGVASTKQAVERGSRLTKSILSYTGKSNLSPSKININEIVRSVNDWGMRVLPKNITVNLELDEGIPPIYVDKYQLENAVLNLALNARDAMQQGGILSISTHVASLSFEAAREIDEDLPAGAYVRLRIADSGVGISDTIINNIFDPYFSTKGIGKGSGLGLSMVFGFVKQSLGGIKVQSRLNEGTEINLYFRAA